jgi:hypothetical protein
MIRFVMGKIMSRFHHYLSLSVGCCDLCGGKSVSVSMGRIVVVFVIFCHYQLICGVIWEFLVGP